MVARGYPGTKDSDGIVGNFEAQFAYQWILVAILNTYWGEGKQPTRQYKWTDDHRVWIVIVIVKVNCEL